MPAAAGFAALRRPVSIQRSSSREVSPEDSQSSCVVTAANVS
jgi:hypothetical protein